MWDSRPSLRLLELKVFKGLRELGLLPLDNIYASLPTREGLTNVGGNLRRQPDSHHCLHAFTGETYVSPPAESPRASLSQKCHALPTPCPISLSNGICVRARFATGRRMGAQSINHACHRCSGGRSTPPEGTRSGKLRHFVLRPSQYLPEAGN